MSVIKDFKTFISKGNVIDLAVAVIIGVAFSAIISSLVDDVITPLLLTPALEAMGAENIADLKWGEVKYGNFLAAILKFFIIALVIFALVRSLLSPPGPSSTDKLLMEIRDELKRN
jgi:large conductance mechanosensitive channel